MCVKLQVGSQEVTEKIVSREREEIERSKILAGVERFLNYNLIEINWPAANID